MQKLEAKLAAAEAKLAALRSFGAPQYAFA